jgi:hypothetical protein
LESWHGIDRLKALVYFQLGEVDRLLSHLVEADGRTSVLQDAHGLDNAGHLGQVLGALGIAEGVEEHVIEVFDLHLANCCIFHLHISLHVL